MLFKLGYSAVFQGVTVSHRINKAQIPEASMGREDRKQKLWILGVVAFILKQITHMYIGTYDARIVCRKMCINC